MGRTNFLAQVLRMAMDRTPDRLAFLDALSARRIDRRTFLSRAAALAAASALPVSALSSGRAVADEAGTVRFCS